MAVRTAALSDLPQLSLLFDAYRIFYKQTSAPEAASNFIQKRLEQADSKIYVYSNSNGLLSGFVQLYPLFSSTRMQRLWLLNDLYVLPEYRGQGQSIQLIERAKELARSTNATGLLLETAKSNVIGNQLYPKMEFKLDAEHNFYFWEGD